MSNSRGGGESGKRANVHAAQQALLHHARCNSAAHRGLYDPRLTGARSLSEDGSRSHLIVLPGPPPAL